MTDAPVATEVHQTLDIHRRLATEIALDDEVGDGISNTGHFGLGKILHHRVRRDASRFADLLRARIANAVDRGQRNHNVFVDRNIDACNSCHFKYP